MMPAPLPPRVIKICSSWVVQVLAKRGLGLETRIVYNYHTKIHEPKI